MATTNNWFLQQDEDANTWASILVEEESVTADSATVTYTVYDFQTVYADSPQIYYDVESTIGTISGGAQFPFASATVDVTGYFSVLESAAQSDLVASYSMRQPIDTQLYSTWRVLIGVEADSPEITYSHGGAVYSDELNIEYTVFTEVETDSAEVTYNVIEGVTSDVGITYTITSTPLTATNTQEVVYNVVKAVEKDLVSITNVLTLVEKDLVYTGNVLESAEQEKTVTFAVYGSTYSDHVTIYTLLSPVNVYSDSIQAYNISADSAIVPNVIGLTVEEATRVLVAAGFTVGTTNTVTLQ